MPSSFLLRSMTSASLVLAVFARCERPTAAFFRASRLQPGCLAHGPEEKQGFFGVWVGFMGENLMIANGGRRSDDVEIFAQQSGGLFQPLSFQGVDILR